MPYPLTGKTQQLCTEVARLLEEISTVPEDDWYRAKLYVKTEKFLAELPHSGPVENNRNALKQLTCKLLYIIIKSELERATTASEYSDYLLRIRKSVLDNFSEFAITNIGSGNYL